MNVHKLDLSQMAAHRATHLVILDHTDLTEATANTAQVIELLTVSAKQAVRLAKVVLATPFKDASDNAFNTNTITIGDGTDPDRLLASTEINENGTEVLLKAGPVGTALPPAVSTADGSDAGTTQALANALKASYNLLLASLAASPFYVYTAGDTVDLTINAMSAKALADIDTGELHVYLDVQDHA